MLDEFPGDPKKRRDQDEKADEFIDAARGRAVALQGGKLSKDVGCDQFALADYFLPAFKRDSSRLDTLCGGGLFALGGSAVIDKTGLDQRRKCRIKGFPLLIRK